MAGATTAILGTGLGLYKTIDGANRRRDAERELANYERQELNNAYKEMPISTMGADLLRDENARASANLVDALRMGGSRSIFAGIPKVVGMTNQINQEAARMLDDQVNRRNYAIAGDNARIESIIENRDNANIAALSSQANAGRQDMWDGIMGTASGIEYGAKNIDWTGEGSWNDQQAEKMFKNLYGPMNFGTPYTIPGQLPAQYPESYFDFSNSYR